MSSSDQAKSKLLDSMRMSKQGSAPETKAPVNETPKQAPAKKAKPASRPASSVAKKAKPTKTAAPKKPIIDNFQAAQRVWPD